MENNNQYEPVKPAPQMESTPISSPSLESQPTSTPPSERPKRKSGGLKLASLVLLILLAAGGIGYSVYAAMQNSSQQSAITEKDSKIADLNKQISTLKASASSDSTSDTSSQASTAQQYLQLSQWGVKVPVSGAISSLVTKEYSNWTSNGAAAALVNVSLSSCAVGAIYQSSSADYHQGDSTRKSTDSDYNAKHIGDNYYYYSYSSVSEAMPSCTTQAIEDQIKAAVTNIQVS